VAEVLAILVQIEKKMKRRAVIVCLVMGMMFSGVLTGWGQNEVKNQDYQYEQLVWELEKRSGGENRLEVNIVFLTDSPGDVSPDAPDARETETPADPDEATDTPYKPVSLAKFDITLVAIEMGDEIILYFKYKNTLFTEQTIRGMGEHLKNILEEAVGGPRIEISGINMLTEEEKDKLVKEMKKDGPAAHGAVRPGAGKPKVDFDF